MKKRKVPFVRLMSALLLAGLLLVGCGKDSEEGETTTEAETVAAVEYRITYELDGGSWNKTLYTLDELWEQFKTQYNAQGGALSTPGDLDTAHLDSADFAKIYSSNKMFISWCWLYSALWKVNDKPDGLNPRSADLTSTEARSFYICQLCGFFSSEKHEDSNFHTVSADFSDTPIQEAVLDEGPTKNTDPGPETYTSGQVTELKGLTKNNYEFVGWRIGDSETAVNSIDASVTGDLTLTAVFKAPVLPEDVAVDALPEDGVPLYSSYQLTWNVLPADTTNTRVYFNSLDTGILTVSNDGVVTAKSTGTGRVRVRLAALPDYEKIIEVKVVKGNYFDAGYLTESYTTVGKDIGLRSCYYDSEGNAKAVTWESLTPDIATVSADGTVHPLKTGLATIRSSYGSTHKLDFTVTVLDEDISEELQFILDCHNSNALTVYNLGIGAGTPVYYYDVVGSVSDLLFADLIVDQQFYGTLRSGENNYGPMSSIEFVTVHYTGNMSKGADADNNAEYFSKLSSGVSIHYVTGRSNQSQYGGSWSEDGYAAFACLAEKYGAWHASTGDKTVIWDKTGVTVEDGDPEKPVITISDDLYYVINGRKTQIKIPTLPDGYTISGENVTYNGKTNTAINAMGLSTKICDGEYCLARTWWGSQRSPKALCTYGGNTNSIGIESCVDIGSDLVHTWHVTAQLVADILERRNLGLDRVVGHHFYSGKDCPQPLLANDMQLWYEFMDMTEAEYRRITDFKDVTFTAKALTGTDYLSDKGLLKQGADSQIVTYEVTIEKNGKKETVTLATAVESYFCYKGERTQLSLQLQGYEIK